MRRPRSRNDSKSPAAWARISLAEPERLAGDRQLVGRSPPRPGRRCRCSARPCGAGRSSGGSAAEAVGVGRSPVRSPSDRASGSIRAVVRLGRIDERLDADVVGRRGRRQQRRRPSPRARACTSPEASTSFVRSFAACTSGWSNGLMPRIEPATAVANSQRKNSCPSSSGAGSRTSCSCRSGPSPGTPGAGTRPLPSLPVDSAISCSTQSPKTAGVRKAHLVAALLPAVAEREPELEPGIALVETASLGHLDRPVEQPLEVDAREGGRERARTATAPSSGRRSSARPGRPRRTSARRRASPATNRDR